jgi:hypothetical protein
VQDIQNGTVADLPTGVRELTVEKMWQQLRLFFKILVRKWGTKETPRTQVLICPTYLK